jgi:iron-sulfur cluster repair protein YtfE (RIC family)
MIKAKKEEKMSALIEELKREHAKIIAMLNEIKEIGILSKEGQARLMSAKECLLEHLKKEDEQLYPVLRKEAERNKNLKKEVAMFTMDPEYVSRVVSEFFDKYSGGEIDEDFSINFESLFAALNARIRNEENALYKEYEEINQ